MPKTVMTLQGPAQVPTSNEMFQQIGYINDNKQEIWDILDQLKDTPPHGTNTDYQRQVRAVREAALSAKEQINGPRQNGEGSIWQYIGEHGKCITAHDSRIFNTETQLDAVGKRLDEVPDIAKEAMREVIHEKFDPLLEAAGKNIGAILEDNRKLREELASLRAEVDKLKAASIS